MADANTLKLYRNSDLNGNALPLDILLSKGLIKQDFTATPANDIALPTDTELLVIYGDIFYDCYVQLTDSIVAPANGVFNAAMHFIPASTVKTIDGNGATEFSVVSADTNAGTIKVECVYAYKDARRAKQHSNI